MFCHELEKAASRRVVPLRVLDNNVLEAPGDAMTNVFAFARNNSTEWANQLLGSGLDALGDKVGTANAFCPAIWSGAVTGALAGIPNPGGGP